jgi:two-component system C4-dicarboxylate transport sensor histidine kinase DctB
VDTLTQVPRDDIGAFALAHRRFERAVLAIYLATAAVALTLLVAMLVSDRAHQEEDARATLLLSTKVRANYLGHYLALLSGELRRLSLRSEIQLQRPNPVSERLRLRLEQERSAFFNVGIAGLNAEGVVTWSYPEDFLKEGTVLANAPWFHWVKHTRSPHIVPVEPEREDALLYVVAPVVRYNRFVGALLGAIDLAGGEAIGSEPAGHGTILIATRGGEVVYPPKPPDRLVKEQWRLLFEPQPTEAFLFEAPLFGDPAVVALVPVAGTDLVFLSVIEAEDFYRPATVRFWSRMGWGLGVVTIPLVALLLVLRRSLRTFRHSEEEAAREERLKTLGVAVNLIAHEFKNSLNGIRLGVDLLVAPNERRQNATTALRREITRLSAFTNDLLLFAKGVQPRMTTVDLKELARRVVELMGDPAKEAGARVSLVLAQSPVIVQADPTLLHSVIQNLIANAIDAVATVGHDGLVTVEVGLDGNLATLRVRDNGPGVSKEVLPHLFEPFVTGKPNGTGLGLALSRKVARAHGGDLVLEEQNPGAVFLLTLPLIQSTVLQEVAS